MRVERTRTLRPPASPDAGVRPSTQPHHHGCRGGAMNQTTQALEHASVRQYCKVLRMPVIGSNFVWLSEQAIKEQRSHIGYLEALLAMEAEERDRHAIQKRIRDAKLPRLKNSKSSTSIRRIRFQRRRFASWPKAATLNAPSR